MKAGIRKDELLHVMILLLFIIMFLLINKHITDKAIKRCIDSGNSYYFCENNLK